ncbi:MAG: hypothetical protein AB1656_26230 [Candidatus Omnitrophota bacterium]
MALDKIILLLIHLSINGIRGKTLLQKRIYFLSIFLKNNFGYRAHYYGPYSPQVDDSLAKMKSLGFVEERSHGYGLIDKIGFEVRRYDYLLTDDGGKIVDNYIKENNEEFRKIKTVFDCLCNSGDTWEDHISLSIAAKIHYIFTMNNSPLKITEIEKKAQNLGWNITPEQSTRAISFLEKLNLIETQH